MKSFVSNDSYPISLLMSPRKLALLQICCEVCEQFVGQPDIDAMIKRYAGEYEISPDDVYTFGDEWSFLLRRILEQEFARLTKNTLPNLETKEHT